MKNVSVEYNNNALEVRYSNGTLIFSLATRAQGAVLFLDSNSPQILAAAGTTQLGATLITSSKAIITIAATNSLKGVLLPVFATGLEVTIGSIATHGVKIYPNVGARISTAASNVADKNLLVAGKQNKYLAASNKQWVAVRG